MTDVTSTPTPLSKPAKPVVPTAGPRLAAGRVASSTLPVASELAAQTSSKGTRETAALRPLPASPQTDSGVAAGQHAYSSVDRAFRANLARLTLGLSPAVLAEQAFDWLTHLAVSPGKQLQLAETWSQEIARFGLYAAQSVANPDTPPCIRPLPQDRRFEGELWQKWPYNLLYQSFLLTQQWWQEATTHVDGVSQRHERSLSFTVRQILDMASPSNFVWTNPELTQATIAQGGQNLLKGFQNFIEDWQRATAGKPPVGAEEFVVGQNVAVTPGKVVFQNRLIELIQYSPMTDQVYAEPILIVPSPRIDDSLRRAGRFYRVGRAYAVHQ